MGGRGGPMLWTRVNGVSGRTLEGTLDSLLTYWIVLKERKALESKVDISEQS